jgi:hypothetical protein
MYLQFSVSYICVQYRLPHNTLIFFRIMRRIGAIDLLSYLEPRRNKQYFENSACLPDSTIRTTPVSLQERLYVQKTQL